MLDAPALAHAQGRLCDTEQEEGYQDMALSLWISKHFASIQTNCGFISAQNFRATYIPSEKL